MGFMGTLVKGSGLAFKLFTFTLTVWALCAIYSLGCVWATQTEASKVFTIQDPGFWGPVTMLVPTNCTLFHQYEQLIHSSSPGDVTASLTAILGEEDDETDFEHSYLGVVKMNEKQKTKFLNLVQLSDCGTNINVPNASGFQKYFTAMWTASAHFDVDGLHASRFRYFWAFAIFIVLFLLIDLGIALIVTCVPAVDEMLDQVGQGGVTGPGFTPGEVVMDARGDFQTVGDPFMGKIAKMGIKLSVSYFMKAMIGTLQTYMLGLFVTMDRGDHLIMSYMPGWAIILTLLWSWCGGPCGQAIAIFCGKKGTACFFCTTCAFNLSIGFPMCIWSYFYNFDFLCQAFCCHSFVPIFDPCVAHSHLIPGCCFAHIFELCFPCAEVAAREVEDKVGEPVYVSSEPLLA